GKAGGDPVHDARVDGLGDGVLGSLRHRPILLAMAYLVPQGTASSITEAIMFCNIVAAARRHRAGSRGGAGVGWVARPLTGGSRGGSGAEARPPVRRTHGVGG